MNSDWSGAFLPIRKHRMYTGNIANHIRFKSVLPLTDDEIESDEYFDLTQLGDGGRAWVVTFAFIPDMQEIAYRYVVYADEATEEQKEHMRDHGLLDDVESDGNDLPDLEGVIELISDDLSSDKGA